MENDEDVYAGMIHSWPETGDRLIRFSSNGEGVHVNSGEFPAEDEDQSQLSQQRVHLRRLLYAEGFLKAADQIIDNFRYLPGNDCFLQPIFFLYRHHIELQLKLVLTLSRTYSPKPAHSLDKLWKEVRNQFPRWDAYFENSTNDAFEVLLEDLNHLDPNSFFARYPDDLSGREVFVGEWQRFMPIEWADIPNVSRHLYVDLRHLKVAVNKMSKFLDGLYEALPRRRQNQI